MDALMTLVSPSASPSPHESTENRKTIALSSIQAQHALFRELAAIFRSDLTLCVSSFEIDLLQRCYNVPVTKLLLSPLYYDTAEGIEGNWLPFNSRQHFCMIGVCVAAVSCRAC
jgi:O-antigen biosynthesis protein